MPCVKSIDKNNSLTGFLQGLHELLDEKCLVYCKHSAITAFPSLPSPSFSFSLSPTPVIVIRIIYLIFLFSQGAAPVAQTIKNLPAVQDLSSAQSLSCVQLCDPKDCSTPGLPVHHQLPELTQIHVHWVSDAIQWSHPLPSPSPPAFNLSQHQGLF